MSRDFDSEWLQHFIARSATAPEHNPSEDAVESEASLHYEIMDFCRDRGWQFLHGSMSERTHRTLGEPDFTILAGAGRVYFVECKSRTGKLRPVQAQFIANATKNGHVVHVVDCTAQFLSIFTEEHHARD
jgi:hypothetical protein